MKKKVIVVNMVAQKQNELITEFESAKQARLEKLIFGK